MLGDLTPEEIERLLRSEAIGRIGCYGFGRPYVVPVTYAYDGVAVYCHSREGLKLRMMRNHPTVCFEVDRVEGVSDWQSVISSGRTRETRRTEVALKHPKSEAGRARARRRGAGLPSLKAAHSAATTAA